jgi:hypothetical protein
MWAAELQRARKKILSATQAVNRKYEGQIKKGGDTVRVNIVGDITVANYTRNSDISLETLDTTAVALLIDQEKAFGFYLDDVDRKQMVADIMPEAMSRAAYKLKDTKDQHLLTTLANGVGETNVLDARTIGHDGGDADPFNLLVDMGVVLDNTDTPEEGRFIFLPPWFCGEILKDPRRTSFGTTKNLAAYGSGYIGRTVGGLEMFKTRNLPTTNSVVTIVAGVRDAATFADQITDYETKRHPFRFGDNHFGLDVYGADVHRPDSLAKCAVTQSSAF